MQTDLNKISSVANNERVLLLSWYSTNCSLTELLELQSPMAEAATDAVAAAAECNSKPECCLFEEIPYFRFHVDTKMSTYLHSISICVFVNVYYLSHK